MIVSHIGNYSDRSWTTLSATKRDFGRFRKISDDFGRFRKSFAEFSSPGILRYDFFVKKIRELWWFHILEKNHFLIRHLIFWFLPLPNFGSASELRKIFRSFRSCSKNQFWKVFRAKHFFPICENIIGPRISLRKIYISKCLGWKIRRNSPTGCTKIAPDADSRGEIIDFSWFHRSCEGS